MMNKMRGRNLAHPGCLVGVTAGLTLGIILASVMAMAYNTALNVVALTWLGITVSLGVIGWFVGHWLSPRFPALESDESSHSEQEE